MKKIFFAFSFLFLLLSLTSHSQDYKTGIGLRGGWIAGLTVKTFIKEGKALEFILSSGYRWRPGYQFTVLYEVHKQAFEVDGLYWLYGGGAHFGGGYSWEHWHHNNNNNPWDGYYHTHHNIAVGIDGIFGIEYKIAEIPITIGVDIKPFFDFVQDRDYPYGGFWDSAFSIRYVF